MTHRANRQLPRGLGRAGIALGVLALALALLGSAPAGAGARAIHFDGKRIDVPDNRPVYRLAQHPGMCVRLDRRVVYLGTPATNQRCPVNVIGGRRAILVEPDEGQAARPATTARAAAVPRAARTNAKASSTSNIFTGLGFDACTAPSSRSMSAWTSSPYRALGVYIGGENRGCSQPNLTAAWVSAQAAAGWHLIPTYVGLQAPTSSCSSCAKIVPSQAIAQGTASAIDAVEDAGAIGMGPGTPIYFDMESYAQTTSATSATLAFLSAWTTKLHSLGYVSGVYSSSSSGIADLADAAGSGADEPDALWIANWNGRQDTVDPNVASNLWAQHQRLHQYRGGHDETYGGVTINIDNNYLDGPTFGAGTLPPVGGDDPVGGIDLASSPIPGQLRVKGWALDPDLLTQTLGIKVFVGGRAGTAGAVEYGLGEIANQPRNGIGGKYPGAGPNHGFDVTLASVKSGPQPVCVYALNTGPGADTLLGCETTNIPVAITLTRVWAPRGGGVKAIVTCTWPTGTACPGQLLLRARVKVPVRARGRVVRTRTVTRSLGRRSFNLRGNSWHVFAIGLTPGGRALLSQHGSLRAQLIAVIPGGRRTASIAVAQP
ncbi:MAG: DUF1906 domain-containing protein [Solirubrobacterales bacterium]